MTLESLIQRLQLELEVRGNVVVVYRTDDYYCVVDRAEYHPSNSSMEPERIELS